MTNPQIHGIDCVRIFVDDLEQGLVFYHNKLGLPLIWRKQDAAGLALGPGNAELVIQTTDQRFEVDLKVDSVETSLEQIQGAGGTVLQPPFDIDIGKAAVVLDPWGNSFVVLDMSKGTYKTDDQGNILGVEK